jgi:hypothetical protein
LIIEIEEIIDLAKGVGMRAAHEAVANEANAQFFHNFLMATKKHKSHKK